MTLLAWVGLNASDAVLTGLSLPMRTLELNPFPGTIALAISLQHMLFIKVMFTVAMGGALWQKGAYRVLRMLNWVIVRIVAYNALIITYALT